MDIYPYQGLCDLIVQLAADLLSLLFLHLQDAVGHDAQLQLHMRKPDFYMLPWDAQLEQACHASIVDYCTYEQNHDTH